MRIGVKELGTLLKARRDGEIPHMNVSLDSCWELRDLVATLGGTGAIFLEDSCKGDTAFSISFNELRVFQIRPYGQSDDDIPL